MFATRTVDFTIRSAPKVLAVSMLLGAAMAALPAAASVPAPAATYLFDDGFAAVEPGAPAIVPVDPLHLNAFEDAVVFGSPRRVYHFDGNSWPVEQAGLSLPVEGVVAFDRYSVELVFEFIETNGVWRRILDVQNRASDNGFYVSPSALEQVWDNGVLADGVTPFTTGEYHHVVLTNDAWGVISAYLDGQLEFTATSPDHAMDVANPEAVLNLFLDNVVGNGLGEFADGRIALLRVYDAVLSDADVAFLAAAPLPRLVAIDVKPGSYPNAINLGSQGVVPVAILGTATFDATSVDPLSVTLASAPVRLTGRGTAAASIQDVNSDGFPDLVVQVYTDALQISGSESLAVLEGKTMDGVGIRGADTVLVVP